MVEGILSPQTFVLICLTSSLALLCFTLWRQRLLLAKYPDVKDQRKRFHGGALSLFFSPTAGHVWFSLAFPWFAFFLVDYWLFHGEVTKARIVSPIPWTIYAVMLVMILLPFLSLQQLERELVALQENYRQEQDRQAIRRQVAALRTPQRRA